MGMGHSALLDELLDPFAQCLDEASAQRVIELDLAPAFQERLDALAERANAGTLTSEEQADYEALINAADFIAIVKLKAQRGLESHRRA
jgi:hypothetical protein